MARFWYSYNGVGDPLLPSSYNRAFSNPTCMNGPIVCVIYSPGIFMPTGPLSYRLITYIANIQLALIPQPDSDFPFKKYVYGRPF